MVCVCVVQCSIWVLTFLFDSDFENVTRRFLCRICTSVLKNNADSNFSNFFKSDCFTAACMWHAPTERCTFRVGQLWKYQMLCRNGEKTLAPSHVSSHSTFIRVRVSSPKSTFHYYSKPMESQRTS